MHPARLNEQVFFSVTAQTRKSECHLEPRPSIQVRSRGVEAWVPRSHARFGAHLRSAIPPMRRTGGPPWERTPLRIPSITTNALMRQPDSVRLVLGPSGGLRETLTCCRAVLGSRILFRARWYIRSSLGRLTRCFPWTASPIQSLP